MREMKDSGVEWIGKIPIDWEVCRLKNVSSIQTGNTPPKNEQSIFYSDESGVPWIKAEDLGRRDSISDTKEYLTEDGVKEGRIFPANTVYVCCIASIGKTGYSEQECSCNQQINGIMFNNRMQWKYGYYMTLAQESEYLFNASGNVMKIINTEKQSNLWCPLPPTYVQKKVSEYLDTKCAKIDSIIEKQQAIIEKLKEYKLSVITEAVTKGLNPNVDMKDSGIRKLNRIPCNWDEIKITRMLDYNCDYPMGDGDHGLIKTDDYKEEGIPYIRVQNLGWGTELSLDNVIYISEEDHEKIKSSELHPNDILFCKTGATIGKTGMIPEGIPIANTTSHVGKITLDKKYNSRFVFYYLSSYIGYVQFWDIACLKSTRPELAIEETKALRIAIPKERNEQDRIVEYLDVKCKDLDLSICKKEKVVEKLQEYKKSLIYEVVTGKKEV